jgi:serine/threonine-protein kinase
MMEESKPTAALPKSPETTAAGNQSPGFSENQLSSIQPGEKLGGRYLVIEALGTGAASAVFRVKDLQLDREVALKLLWGKQSDAKGCDSLAERISSEAKVLAKLDHPNIVPVYDAGEIARGYPFLTMGLVRGRSLSAVLQTEGPMDLPRSLHIIRQVLDALDYAHRHGVLHCDIKSSNILLEDGDRVRLVDFGIACLLSASSSPAKNEGRVFGTAGYTAPEVIKGKQPGPQSDIFSTGAVLYRMLTGRNAFEGSSSLEIVEKTLTEEPPHAESVRKGIPKGVGKALSKAMAKFPEQRYADGRTMVRALERIQMARKTIRFLGAATLFLMLAGTAFGIYWLTRPLEVTARLECETRSPGGQYISVPVQDGMQLHSGDRLFIADFKSNRSAFVYVFLLSAGGELEMHFPAEGIPLALPLKSGRSYQIPAEKQRWILDEREGPETFFLAASRKEIPPAEISKLVSMAGSQTKSLAMQKPDPDRGVELQGAEPSTRLAEEKAVEALFHEYFPVVTSYRFNHLPFPR